MKQEIPFTDAELRELYARIKRGEESPNVVDTLTDAEVSRMNTLTSPEAPPSVMEGTGSKIARYSRILPSIGGAVGGTIGGAGGFLGGLGAGSVPGALAGAAIGGGAGDLLSMGIRKALGSGAPESLPAAGTELLKESALQVPMELGGRAIAGGAKVLGRGLYDAALRPTRTLLDEFPDVVKTALRERLPVGDVIPGVTKRGSQMAREARQASGRVTHNLLEKAGAQGVRFRMQDVMERPVGELAEQIRNQPETRADLEGLGRFVREVLKDKSGDISPVRLKAIKQAAQSIANPVFKAERAGSAVTAAQSLSARANRAVATGARETLETVPGVGESEKLTQALIGATKAIRQAEARRAPLTTHILSGVAGGGGVVGGAVGGGGPKDDATLGLQLYLLTRIAASPRTLSRAGIQISRDSVQQLMRALPYAAEGIYAATTERGRPE